MDSLQLFFTSKDKFARKFSIKSIDILTFISITFSVPILGLLSIYTNVNLQKATRLALKLFIKSQKYC